jgi:hypothetical protein
VIDADALSADEENIEDDAPPGEAIVDLTVDDAPPSEAIADPTVDDMPPGEVAEVQIQDPATVGDSTELIAMEGEADVPLGEDDAGESNSGAPNGWEEGGVFPSMGGGSGSGSDSEQPGTGAVGVDLSDEDDDAADYEKEVR